MAPQALVIARNGLENGGAAHPFPARPLLALLRERPRDIAHRRQVGEGVKPAVLGNVLRGPHEAAVDPRGSPPSAELVSS